MDGERAIQHFEHASELGWWSIETGEPHPALRACARRYASYAESTTGFTRRRELPWAGVALIIGFGDPIEIAYDDGPGRAVRHRAFLAAVHDVPVTVDSFGVQRGVQVDLTPLGARRLFGVPQDELANTVVDLEAVLGVRGRRLAERLEDLPGAAERFALLDAVFARRLLEAPAAPPVIAYAWERLRRSFGGVGVAELATDTGVSRRHLSAEFTRHVGLPPRTLSRILRFERLVDRITAPGELRWAELALECGYYDQAHLAREVRALAHATPTELAAARLPDGGGLTG